MPNFSPNGLVYSRSLSNTSPMTNGTERFLWDPVYHGFSGDLAVGNIIAVVATDNTEETYSIVGSYNLVSGNNNTNLSPIFPCPITGNTGTQNFGGGDFPPGVSPLGVLSTFSYTPLGANEEITVNNFQAGTLTAPNTYIYANVIVDPMGVYTMQSFTPWGVSVNATREFMGYGAITTYPVTVKDNNPTPSTYTYHFPLGNFSGVNAGSVAFLFTVQISNSTKVFDASTIYQRAQIGLPLSSIGLTIGIEDNFVTVPNGTAYPNVYYDVVLANQYFSAGITSSGRYIGKAQI